VKILLYANTAEKARVILPWVRILSRHFITSVTVQTTRRATEGERAASELFRRELTDTETLKVGPVVKDLDLPEEGIAREVQKGDYNLVIMTPAGRRGVIRLFYGSMVGKVIRRVSTSVLIAREGIVPPRRILVCVSGSRHSLTNVRAAARLAVVLGCPVTIMMVISQLPVSFAGQDPGSREEGFLASDHQHAAHLRAALDLLHNLGAEGSVLVREGLVVDEILDELEGPEHDLLILGTHRAEDYDPMYEDLTAELVQRATVTTLVVGLRADLL
jgi:nucleotide-binding universal stress UspA family protein